MEMRMEPEFLIPGVQHAEETNLCTEVFRIASHFEKCFRGDTKQEIVEDFFVVQHQRSQVAGEREDHMQVARGEQFSLTGGDPPFPSRDLTLWTVTITAAVVREGGMMSAAHALIEMPTECGSTTARNGQQYLDVLPANPLAVSLDEGSSSRADEIGNLERRRGHWGTSSSNVTHIYIKTAGRSLLRSSCVASAAGRLRPNAVLFTNSSGIIEKRALWDVRLEKGIRSR
jgi:hypothetical protein